MHGQLHPDDTPFDQTEVSLHDVAVLQRTRGEGRLSVEQTDGRTRICRLHQSGAAKIRFPGSQADGRMEAILINTSGGLTGGDRLSWSVEAGPRSELMITTQACEKIYKSVGGAAHVETSLAAGPGSRLYWLPQETILFDRAQFHRSLTTDLADDAEALFVEPIVFGRRAMGEQVCSGAVHDRWRIRVGGKLIHAEDFRIGGDIDAKLADRWITGGATAIATVLLIGPHVESYITPAREMIGDHGGVSVWNGKLLARILAEDSYQLRKTLLPLMRLLMNGAALPKVWSV